MNKYMMTKPLGAKQVRATQMEIFNSPCYHNVILILFISYIFFFVLEALVYVCDGASFSTNLSFFLKK